MKIGDKVSVVDEDLYGIITSVIGNMVVFKDHYDFTHQFPKEKLLLRDESLYQNLKTETKSEVQKFNSKKHAKNNLVLDLHFEKLVRNTSDYNAYERLFLQKEKLLETIEFCKKNKVKKLEIIHGIGDGTLQKMVYEVLESQGKMDFHNNEILHQQSGAVIVYF